MKMRNLLYFHTKSPCVHHTQKGIIEQIFNINKNTLAEAPKS